MATILSGKTQPDSCTWVNVPETCAVQIYPIIRKPSVTCSNTFIIKSPRFFIVIDPGADMEQIEQIRQIVLSQQQEQLIPVFIFLTHCHIDHFLAIHRLLDETFNAQIICHSVAADAIESRDESITLANMNGSALPICRVRSRFFRPGETIMVPAEDPLSLVSGTIELEEGQALPLLVIPLGGQDRMDVFPTPGHSPDSVCYRVGTFICTGDLHLATTPGIAGKTGWDNDQLVISLKAVLEKGKKDGITHILPGHGNILSFDKAERIFLDVSKDARRLTGLVLFDRERSLYLSEYAIVLLEEASSIFAIIAARLMKISYYLEMLDENESAEAILRAVDSDTIDTIVEEFQSFIVELQGKRGAPVISKAVQFSRKVGKLFELEKIAALFDPYFLRRIKNLLSDFVNVVYGTRFADQETLFDLNDVVEETLTTLNKNLGDNEKIFDVLDDNQEFVNELTKRIAYTPLFAAVRFSFSRSQNGLPVTADRLILQDMLTALLEQLAIAEITSISLATDCDCGETFLTVTPGAGNKHFALRESKILYLQHSLRLAGGEFQRIVSAEAETYRFIFSRKDK